MNWGKWGFLGKIVDLTFLQAGRMIKFFMSMKSACFLTWVDWKNFVLLEKTIFEHILREGVWKNWGFQFSSGCLSSHGFLNFLFGINCKKLVIQHWKNVYFGICNLKEMGKIRFFFSVNWLNGEIFSEYLYLQSVDWKKCEHLKKVHFEICNIGEV